MCSPSVWINVQRGDGQGEGSSERAAKQEPRTDRRCAALCICADKVRRRSAPPDDNRPRLVIPPYLFRNPGREGKRGGNSIYEQARADLSKNYPDWRDLSGPPIRLRKIDGYKKLAGVISEQTRRAA
jgi:hypothetical protein